jgi:hypothetical protein
MTTIAQRARDVELFGSRFLITYDEKGITIRKMCTEIISAVCVYRFLVNIFDNWYS